MLFEACIYTLNRIIERTKYTCSCQIFYIYAMQIVSGIHGFENDLCYRYNILIQHILYITSIEMYCLFTCLVENYVSE